MQKTSINKIVRCSKQYTEENSFIFTDGYDAQDSNAVAVNLRYVREMGKHDNSWKQVFNDETRRMIADYNNKVYIIYFELEDNSKMVGRTTVSWVFESEKERDSEYDSLFEI